MLVESGSNGAQQAKNPAMRRGRARPRLLTHADSPQHREEEQVTGRARTPGEAVPTEPSGFS